jgi:hypothetical protein
MDTKRISASGDPFYAAGEVDRPHACLNGYVYIGRITEQDGEEEEVIEAVPCRRCEEAS